MNGDQDPRRPLAAEVVTALSVAAIVAAAVVLGSNLLAGEPIDPGLAGQTGTPSQSESEPEPETPDPGEESTPEEGVRAEVTDIELTAEPTEFIGPCPTTVTVSARIRTNTGPVTVHYRWLDADEGSGGDDTVQFGGPGPQGVTVTDTIDVEDDMTVLRRLEVTAPNEVVSDSIEIPVTCTPTAETSAGADEVLGACSHKLHFDGRITVPHGPTTVTYKWERSREALTISFPASGRQTIEVPDLVLDITDSGEYTERITILSPHEATSNASTFTIEC